MHVLIGIALKSLVVAGLTLGLLQLMKSRSAAERSWVAHTGLLALVIVGLAPLVLPTVNIEIPALLGTTKIAAPIVQSASTTPTISSSKPIAGPAQHVAAKSAGSALSLSPSAAVTAVYAVPAAILLLITLLALVRLVALQARADVLVDGHWLSALARAQRRMGFKHGTALLTSDELASPISWGLVRPVILLNKRAVDAADEAEAIIAHELAHVARMDWIKLLLARFATALFWFNPLVWMLAREAHQLREEAADDSVLAADIVDIDYAQLLVGVARHECPGLLLGAHGVAPSKSSLARRVARVLDGRSERGPVARSFAFGVFTGAVLVAAPLAAVTLTPAGSKSTKAAAAKLSASEPAPYYPAHDEPTDLPSIIAKGVTTSVTTAMAAVAPSVIADSDNGTFEAVAPNGASVRTINGVTVSRAANGATVTVYPPDAHGRRKVVAVAPNGATAESYDGPNDTLDSADAGDSADAAEAIADARAHRLRRGAIDNAIAMKAAGVTPEYVAAMRAAAPELRDADADDLMGAKAVGVTPDYVRGLYAAGIRNFDTDDLAGARAVGVDGNYAREMRAAGFKTADLSDLTGARAVGITGTYIREMRANGYDGDLQDFTALKSMVGSAPPVPPLPPRPPRN